MAETHPGGATTPSVPDAPEFGSEGRSVLFRGDSFSLGTVSVAGVHEYRIWDRADSTIANYPPTREGWTQAWTAFLEREPRPREAGGVDAKLPPPVIVSTRPGVDGRPVKEELGPVLGVCVVSLGARSGLPANPSPAFRGQVSESAQTIEEARREALRRMTEQARTLGANAVLSVAFDSSAVGNDLLQLGVSGTAVVIEEPTGTNERRRGQRGGD